MEDHLRKRNPTFEGKTDAVTRPLPVKSKGKAGISDFRIYAVILILRLISIPFVQTYFAPDEYWQAGEVAHYLVYGRGYLTWEWTYGLRSYLHPLSIAFIYEFLNTVGLGNNVDLIVLSPRIFQAIFSAGAEICFYKFVKRHFGQEVAFWMVFSLCTSWMWFYCASRTLMNTVEAGMICFALYLFPWDLHQPQSKVMRKISCFTAIASLAVVLRPTSASVWFPMYVWLFYKLLGKPRTFMHMFLRVALISLMVLAFSLTVDRIFYGHWTFTQYNFFQFNVISGKSVHYGAKPWHWYFTEGIPVISGTHLPFILHGTFLLLKNSFAGKHRENKNPALVNMLLAICLSTVLMYSISAHKEHRFLINLLTILCLFSGISINSLARKFKLVAVTWLLVTNIPISLYFGLVHLSAPLKVVDFLQRRATEDDVTSVSSAHFALFLTPCHSTPYYSHIHHNVSMQFLTCNPNLNDETEYVTEYDVFLANPNQWLEKNILHSSLNCPANLPKYIIIYDTTLDKVWERLRSCYQVCFDTFHSHFQFDGQGSRMHVLCLKT